MSNVVKLSDYQVDPWEETFSSEVNETLLQVFVNRHTGAMYIVQVNSDGESLRTVLAPSHAVRFRAALASDTASDMSLVHRPLRSL